MVFFYIGQIGQKSDSKIITGYNPFAFLVAWDGDFYHNLNLNEEGANQKPFS